MSVGLSCQFLNNSSQSIPATNQRRFYILNSKNKAKTIDKLLFFSYLCKRFHYKQVESNDILFLSFFSLGITYVPLSTTYI